MIKAPYQIRLLKKPEQKDNSEILGMVLELSVIKQNLLSLEEKQKQAIEDSSLSFSEKIEQANSLLEEASLARSEAEGLIERLYELSEQIQITQKGEKGDRGESIQGLPGKNADPKEVAHLVVPLVLEKLPAVPTISEIVSSVLPLIPEPVPGKDGETPSLIKILEEFHVFLEKKPLKTKHIEGFEQTISALKNQTRQGYLHGGGVPSLSAGSNVTLTAKSDGGFIVSASGGSNIATEQLTGTQSGSDVTLDLTQLAHVFTGVLFISRQGQILTPNTSYTVVTNTATIINANANNVFLVNYTYA